jgi:hypothetical protein
MKTLKLLAIGIILLVSSSIQAQVSVNLNIGTAPSWGLWMHKQNTIICQMFKLIMTLELQFVYFGNNRWVRSRYLPRQYRNYDLYNGYKVVLNGYHGNRPYAHYRNHRQRYSANYRIIVKDQLARHDNHRYAKIIIEGRIIRYTKTVGIQMTTDMPEIIKKRKTCKNMAKKSSWNINSNYETGKKRAQ